MIRHALTATLSSSNYIIRGYFYNYLSIYFTSFATISLFIPVIFEARLIQMTSKLCRIHVGKVILSTEKPYIHITINDCISTVEQSFYEVQNIHFSQMNIR